MGAMRTVNLEAWEKLDEEDVPVWVRDWVRTHQVECHDATHAGRSGVFLVLKGRHYRYLLEPLGQSGFPVTVRRRLRRRFYQGVEVGSGS